MQKTTKIAVALALIVATIMVVAGSLNYNSTADAAALPFQAASDNATPVRATKGDRLDAAPKIRQIAGVTLVLRDFDRAVR